MKKRVKGLLSLILAVAMILVSSPVTVEAADVELTFDVYTGIEELYEWGKPDETYTKKITVTEGTIIGDMNIQAPDRYKITGWNLWKRTWSGNVEKIAEQLSNDDALTWNRYEGNKFVESTSGGDIIHNPVLEAVLEPATSYKLELRSYSGEVLASIEMAEGGSTTLKSLIENAVSGERCWRGMLASDDNMKKTAGQIWQEWSNAVSNGYSTEEYESLTDILGSVSYTGSEDISDPYKNKEKYLTLTDGNITVDEIVASVGGDKENYDYTFKLWANAGSGIVNAQEPSAVINNEKALTAEIWRNTYNQTSYIPVLSIEHQFSKALKTDDTNHWYECELCGAKKDIAPHTYGAEWKTDDTNHWHECVCGAKKDVTQHTYGTEWKTDGTNHWHECVCGAKKDVAQHIYGTEWKTDGTNHWYECECGAKKDVAQHIYGTEWKTDDTNHWYECELCGAKKDIAPHTYGAEWKTDDTNHWHECVCGAKKDVTQHTYGTEWKTDGTNHWHECECGAKKDVAQHTYGTEWKTDGTNHWRECECGEKTDIASHISDGGVVTVQPTETQEGVKTYSCTVCGYVIREEKIPAAGNAKEPQIKGDDGTKGWDSISNKISESSKGDSITVDMNGTTVVPGNVIDLIKGKDITLIFDMGGGITWTVKGTSVTADKMKDIDFGVTVGNKGIPVDVINKVTGERETICIHLAYDGKFGCTVILTINLNAKNAGLYANLFYYNPTKKALEFMDDDKIDANGNAQLRFTHASDYTIVIDYGPMDGSTNNKDKETSVKTGDTSGNIWMYIWSMIIAAVIVLEGNRFYLRSAGKKKRR